MSIDADMYPTERHDVEQRDVSEENDSEDASTGSSSPDMVSSSTLPSSPTSPTSPIMITTHSQPTSTTSSSSYLTEVATSSSTSASHTTASPPRHASSSAKLATSSPSGNIPPRSHHAHYVRPNSPHIAAPPVPSARLHRVRGLGLTPLTTSSENTSHPRHCDSNSAPLRPLGSGQLPKSQPLARALYAKMAGNDLPHAGLGGLGSGKKKGSQKLIVPSKNFKTRFELSLTASELARQ